MSFQRIALVFSAAALFSVAQAQAQPPTTYPKRFAGAWESVSAPGIDGFFLKFETLFSGPPEHQQIAWQEVQIRVYHRQHGKETSGWFDTRKKARPQSYRMRGGQSFTLFDGKRLRIHFTGHADLKPFDLDVTFSSAARDWTGTLVRSGKVRHAVFERPRPGALIPNVFVGDWASEPDSNFGPPLAPGSLHVRESSDGVLSAWLERTIGERDERDGEPLRIVSATGSSLILDAIFPIGPSFEYRGTLSDGDSLLKGRWSIMVGEHFNAPDTFRRVPTGAARRDYGRKWTRSSFEVTVPCQSWSKGELVTCGLVSSA